MKKLDKLQDELKKYSEGAEIARKLNEVDPNKGRELVRYYESKKSFVKARIAEITNKSQMTEFEKQQRRESANRRRSYKVGKSWRYFRGVGGSNNKNVRYIRSAWKRYRESDWKDDQGIVWEY